MKTADLHEFLNPASVDQAQDRAMDVTQQGWGWICRDLSGEGSGDSLESEGIKRRADADFSMSRMSHTCHA